MQPMSIYSEHALRSPINSESPSLQPFLHLVRVEALPKPSAYLSIAMTWPFSDCTVATYLYFDVTRDGIDFDVVLGELQLLGNLIPQGSRISYDLLDHCLFLGASGSCVVVDREVLRRCALNKVGQLPWLC